MKDARLIITILISLVLSLAVVMVSFNLAPSWSQYARTLEEPLLFATLISVSFVFLIKSYSHDSRDLKLFNVFGMNVRNKHLNKFTSVCFALVLVFPVTHPYAWISNAHLVFTALAIGSAYVEMGFYSRTLLSYIGIGLGAALFFIAYLLKLYTVGLGELFATIPIAIFTIYNIKKISNI